eukprot:6179595-Pleurochrysis_carterae.AAC.1
MSYDYMYNPASEQRVGDAILHGCVHRLRSQQHAAGDFVRKDGSQPEYHMLEHTEGAEFLIVDSMSRMNICSQVCQRALQRLRP